jgi:uncharacterized membrane protein SpoIIM required for sporulation
VIIDFEKFLGAERAYWDELERLLNRLASDPQHRLDLDQARRFHYLYERTSADLGKLTTFASGPETRRYLEALVARAYGEIHETRERRHGFSPLKWLFQTFPQTFRRHIRPFQLTVLITLAGCLFGGLATAFDPESRHATMPFGHDRMRPSERVRWEEEGRTKDRLAGRKSSFSAQLMTHNTNISITTLALGMTWAVGTIILLFYNGVALGAICVDYIADGQSKFLAGWLLPHGSIEIPAILIAGQAGLVLGRALIGWGKRTPLRSRLRAITPDLATLIGGVALMLVWAGIIESFFSQYHEPVLPYELKILFGLAELGMLTLFLSRAGGKAAVQRSPNLPS